MSEGVIGFRRGGDHVTSTPTEVGIHGEEGEFADAARGGNVRIHRRLRPAERRAAVQSQPLILLFGVGVDMRAESDVDGAILALARGWRPDDSGVARAWPLLLDAFEHQGRPAGNLRTIIGMLDGSSRIGGWDEFGMEEVAGEPARVEVWFIDQVVTCDRALLLAELSALRDQAGA